MKPSFNLRSSFKDVQIDYIASLRDDAILSVYGLEVDIKTPKKENNLDLYINYTDNNKDDFYYSKSCIVPKFKEYRQILSQLGNTAEENYPLECTIPSALHLPRNSRIILNEYDSNENKVAREWRVLSTVDKQLSNSKSYTRIAYLTPDRTSILNTAVVIPVTCTLSFNPITDYQILKRIYARSYNYVKYSVNEREEPKKPLITAEVICKTYWSVKLPSILY